MAEEKKSAAITPQTDGTRYFKPNENFTLIIPTGYDSETKKHEKHHFLVLKKGVVYATNKAYEITALNKKGVKEVSKPKEKAPIDED